MYKKLVLLSPFLFPPKKMREERKGKKVAKPGFNNFFMLKITRLLNQYLSHQIENSQLIPKFSKNILFQDYYTLYSCRKHWKMERDVNSKPNPKGYLSKL